MKVYVARHAQTNYNVLGICNDDPSVNVYLTPEGIKQAEKLAKTLKTVDFNLIITSEFPRTKETAKILNKHHNAPTIVDSRINDVITGFEGRSAKEFVETRINSGDRWNVRLNGGKSFEDEKARIKAFLDDLKKRPEATVLVVTHQAIARIINGIVQDLPNEKVNDLEVSNTHCFDFEL